MITIEWTMMIYVTINNRDWEKWVIHADFKLHGGYFWYTFPAKDRWWNKNKGMPTGDIVKIRCKCFTCTTTPAKFGEISWGFWNQWNCLERFWCLFRFSWLGPIRFGDPVIGQVEGWMRVSFWFLFLLFWSTNRFRREIMPRYLPFLSRIGNRGGVLFAMTSLISI